MLTVECALPRPQPAPSNGLQRGHLLSAHWAPSCHQKPSPSSSLTQTLENLGSNVRHEFERMAWPTEKLSMIYGDTEADGVDG